MFIFLLVCSDAISFFRDTLMEDNLPKRIIFSLTLTFIIIFVYNDILKRIDNKNKKE